MTSRKSREGVMEAPMAWGTSDSEMEEVEVGSKLVSVFCEAEDTWGEGTKFNRAVRRVLMKRRLVLVPVTVLVVSWEESCIPRTGRVTNSSSWSTAQVVVLSLWKSRGPLEQGILGSGRVKMSS